MKLTIYKLTHNETPQELTNKNAIDKIKKQGCAVALGNFDGVHCGHTALLRKTAMTASGEGIPSAVFLFTKHPSHCLGNPIPLITTNEDKLEIISSLGIDYAVLGEFDELRDLSPEEFVSQLLIDKLGCRLAFCGYNYSFGRGGSGNAMKLAKLMEENGRSAVIIDRIDIAGIPTSSSVVRDYIEAGDMETASKLLGRHYFLNSTVVDGKKLGRKLGMPTINQHFSGEAVLPAFGVYACLCKVGDELYTTVTNIGYRPTVNDDETNITCESHLIGYSGDLYGKTIKVRFYHRLRGEMKFDSTKALQAQMERDIRAATAYFDSL